MSNLPPSSPPNSDGGGLTAKQLEDALKAAASANWQGCIQAFKDKGLNLGEDLKVADNVLTIAALLGVPDAALADALVKLLIFLKVVMDEKGIGFIPPWDPTYNQQWQPSMALVAHATRRGQTDT